MPPKLTKEIVQRYNRFNDARRKAGVPLIGDPMSVKNMKTDTLPRQRKGTSAYARKAPRRSAYRVPLMDNKKIAEEKAREKAQTPAPTPAEPKKASPPNYAKGGKVKKTGMAKVHKGEVVLTASQARMMKKILG